MITAGIDMGSRSIKVVLLEELKVDGAPPIPLPLRKRRYNWESISSSMIPRTTWRNRWLASNNSLKTPKLM